MSNTKYIIEAFIEDLLKKVKKTKLDDEDIKKIKAFEEMVGKSLDIRENKEYFNDENEILSSLKKDTPSTQPQRWKPLNILGIGLLHLLFLIFAPYMLQAKILTWIWMFLMVFIVNIGVTAGVHRMWCHKSYKAKLPLRIGLMLAYTLGGENSIYNWSRDHRVHHKFCDTNADPYNSQRGFWYSHVGWLLMTKNKETFERGKKIDMSDLIADPVVQFNEKYFYPLTYSMFFLEFIIPYLLWGEILIVCFASSVSRYVMTLNGTWAVNSWAHMYGDKPYNKSLSSVENFIVSLITSGEGWHNYHHTFPFDFKASEYGKYSPTTGFIMFMKKLGQVYDEREASETLIQAAIKKNS